MHALGRVLAGNAPTLGLSSLEPIEREHYRDRLGLSSFQLDDADAIRSAVVRSLAPSPGGLFETSAGNDDWYWMYAAIESQLMKIASQRRDGSSMSAMGSRLTPADSYRFPSTVRLPDDHRYDLPREFASIGKHSDLDGSSVPVQAVHPLGFLGNRTCVVTNDEMRDHAVLATDDERFARWRTLHTIHPRRFRPKTKSGARQGTGNEYVFVMSLPPALAPHSHLARVEHDLTPTSIPSALAIPSRDADLELKLISLAGMLKKPLKQPKALELVGESQSHHEMKTAGDYFALCGLV